VEKVGGSELLKVGSVGEVERVPDVTNVVTTDDQTAAAYATQPRGKAGDNVRGGVIYARTAGGGQVHKLSLPTLWEPRVLAYAEGKVFFRAGAEVNAAVWSLYSWTPGSAEATQVKTIESPTAVTRDAKIAASRTVAGEYGTCSNVTEIATGKRLWRTCEYQVDGFTPDGTVAIGGPHYADGYAPLQTSALDARTGNLLREWSGAAFSETFVEDDQHFLIIADDGPETPHGIIRCTLPTGSCELAVPLTTKHVELGK
jgi:hypothetical protein